MTKDGLIFLSGSIYATGVNLMFENESTIGFLFMIAGFVLFILAALNGGDTDAFG